jgi:hypothetical protein
VPDNLLSEFTQNGEMPITRSFYFNEVYSDATSNNNNQSNEKQPLETISKAEVDSYRMLDGKNRKGNYYGDWYSHLNELAFSI